MRKVYIQRKKERKSRPAHCREQGSGNLALDFGMPARNRHVQKREKERKKQYGYQRPQIHYGFDYPSDKRQMLVEKIKNQRAENEYNQAQDDDNGKNERIKNRIKPQHETVSVLGNVKHGVKPLYKRVKALSRRPQHGYDNDQECGGIHV